MMTLRKLLVMCVLLTVVPVIGRADEVGARRTAKAHVQRGSTFYAVAKFAAAAEEYTAAYELVQAPELLFNVGQCYRKLGHHRDAIFFYQGYLRAHPRAANRALVKSLIDESQRVLAAEPVPIAPEAVARRYMARAEAVPLLPRDVPRRAKGKPLVRRWWFWVAVGSAAAVAGVAVWQAWPETLPAGSVGTLDAR